MTRQASKVGRNESCPCGSGKKYKRCCETSDQTRGSRALLIGVAAAVLAALVIGISQMGRDSEASGPRRVWSAEHGHYHDVP